MVDDGGAIAVIALDCNGNDCKGCASLIDPMWGLPARDYRFTSDGHAWAEDSMRCEIEGLTIPDGPTLNITLYGPGSSGLVWIDDSTAGDVYWLPDQAAPCASLRLD